MSDELCQLDFRSPATSQEWDAYYDLRWRILREPWNQPRGSEKDDQESSGQHLAAVTKSGRILAVGRLHFNSPEEAQVRFMAADSDSQGRGLGGRILDEFERRSRASGANRVVLNAREDAERFYARHGFVVVGPAPTIFSSVKHVRMMKILAA